MNRRIISLIVMVVVAGCGRKEPSSASAPADRPSTNAATQVHSQDVASDGNVAGKWLGAWESKAPRQVTVKMELMLSEQDHLWKGKCWFTLDGNSSANTREVTVADGRISFRCDFASDSEFRFCGEITGSEMKGPLEIFEKGQKVAAGTWSVRKGNP